MSLYIYPELDDYNELLNSELEENKFIDKINYNILKLESILKHILIILENEKKVSSKDIDEFTKAIKFIDNLNIFIRHSKIKIFLKIMKNIGDKLNNKKNFQNIIELIYTTEKNIVTYEIDFFEKLFFSNSNEIKNAINKELNKVNKDDYFDTKHFKQIQNIYWILKNKVSDGDRKIIEDKIYNLKNQKHYFYNNNSYYYNNKYYKKNYNKYNSKQYIKYPKMIEVEINSDFNKNNIENKKEIDTNFKENKESDTKQIENLKNSNNIRDKIININSNNSININISDKDEKPINTINIDNIKININNDNVIKINNKMNKSNRKNKCISKNYIFYSTDIFKNNPQMINEELYKIINDFKQQKSEITLKNFISSNYEYYNSKDKILYEYLSHKKNLFENPKDIYSNIKQFEDKILLPLYEKITSKAIEEKKNLEYLYNKYKKIIDDVLSEFNIIEEIAPYGSYVNNFMGEKGDLDICIIPKIPWFSCRGYARKIINYIKNNNKGDITLFHSAAYAYLSSYALIIMIIHFLQNIVKPQILPNLQKIPDNDDFDNPIYKENIYKYYNKKKEISTNLYYESDKNKIEKYMNYINKGEKNEESVGNLILKFFEYYSYYYDDKYFISIKRNSLEECLKVKNDNYAFSIEDPFENNKNPGSSMTKNSPKNLYFVECMKKEINNILSGQYLK